MAEPKLTPARARAMLADLLAGFSSKSFQRKLDVLFSAQAGQNPQAEKDLLFVPGRTELALSVQREVLPRYGFDGSEHGVAQMLEAIQPLLAKDSRLVEQSEAIRQKLRIEVAVHECSEEVNARHLTREKALSLQNDLLDQLRKPEVQMTLVKLRTGDNPDLQEQFIKEVKMSLLPQYGFSADDSGLQMMTEALKEWEWDDEMRSLSKTIEGDLQKGNFQRQDTGSTVDSENGSGSGSEDSISKEEILQLLQELLSGFESPGFQWKLSLLKGRGLDPFDGIEELAFRVQKKILPKYGFQGSRRGVAEMINECNRYAHDEAILDLQTKINAKLGMDTKGQWFWCWKA